MVRQQFVYYTLYNPLGPPAPGGAPPRCAAIRSAVVLGSASGYRLRQHQSRSHDAVITVYDADGKVIEVHRHKGDFKEP